MVSLTLGTLIAGGVMGVISVSLQYTQRVKDRVRIQPYLEAAAQEILSNPDMANGSVITVGDAKNPVQVDVLLTPVLAPDGGEVGSTNLGQLNRVLLRCQGRVLEFSVLIPQSEFR
jgi:hypothetical protein